jgi:hypothetical protein
MKLAVVTAKAAPSVAPQSGGVRPKPSFAACRSLLTHQPAGVAARLARLMNDAETAIAHGAPSSFAKARRLEEAVGYVAWLRPSHEETRQLQLGLAGLMREFFPSPEWRTPLVVGLRPGDERR